jgi:dUTP pyrophosphatase
MAASFATERRRSGWRWHLSYWLGRLYRVVRLFLLPPNRQPPKIEDLRPPTIEDDLAAYDDEDALFFDVEDDVTPPRRMTAKAIGYDIFSPRNFHLKAGDSLSVDVGFRVRPPAGYYAKLQSRSSLASRHIDCFPGILDPGESSSEQVVRNAESDPSPSPSLADYPKNVRCLLVNRSSERVDFARGDRIAQLVLERDNNNNVRTVVKKRDRLHVAVADPSRRRGGFGSTGK